MKNHLDVLKEDKLTLSSSGVDGMASETKSSHSNLIKIWTYLPMYSQSSSSSSSSSSKLIRLNPLGGNFSLANFNCSLRGLGVPSSLRGLKVLCSRFLRPGVINGVLVHKLFGSTNSVGSNSMSSITLPFSTFFRRAGITRGVLLLFAPVYLFLSYRLLNYLKLFLPQNDKLIIKKLGNSGNGKIYNTLNSLFKTKKQCKNGALQLMLLCKENEIGNKTYARNSLVSGGRFAVREAFDKRSPELVFIIFVLFVLFSNLAEVDSRPRLKTKNILVIRIIFWQTMIRVYVSSPFNVRLHKYQRILFSLCNNVYDIPESFWLHNNKSISIQWKDQSNLTTKYPMYLLSSFRLKNQLCRI
uniref:Uncharacterized protein n=1 Tax=Glossina palpalis gambiensis TaxID=67801 RepID=A0A1B0AMQ7_9MUSC